jgi:hypothetical protein
MLGEIFGLSAGLTMVEQTLFLFLALRTNFGSPFFPFVMEKAGLVGVDMASSMGLGLPDTAAPGVLSGSILGVFRAVMRGVSSPSQMTVSNLVKADRSNDASGRVKSSIKSGVSTVSLKLGEGWIRIREAGVAGVAPWPFIWASMAGDWLKDVGFGGGRISDNMGSGEMESVSEASRLCGTSRPLEDGRTPRASCMSSVTSLGGIREETVAFRRPGFTMGDCRTRLLGFADRGALRLLVLLNFRPVSCCVMAGSPRISISTSMGECPVELPEVVCCECWCACW